MNKLVKKMFFTSNDEDALKDLRVSMWFIFAAAICCIIGTIAMMFV